MTRYIYVLQLLTILISAPAHSAVMVFTGSGASTTYLTEQSLETARTSAEGAGKTIVVTSALTESQSNLSGPWPADRALEIKNGGSIANSTAFVVNGPFSAGLYQCFTGNGRVTFGTGSTSLVYSEWFGAKGDGATDDRSAFNAAIAAASPSKIPLQFLPKVYAFAGGIKVASSYVYLKGSYPASTYGPYPQGTTFKFTSGGAGSIGLTTLANPTDEQNPAFIYMENIAIDGCKVIDYGIRGGFFTNLTNVHITGCNVAGLHSKAGQATSYTHCSFNGNYDGVLIEDGAIGNTTQYFKQCVFRQNTRYGVNIIGTGAGSGSISMESPIFENNGGSGTNISGTVGMVHFSGVPYWESNDIALGTKGCNLRVNLNRLVSITGITQNNIVIDNGCFATSADTKIAIISSGTVYFNYCSNAFGDHLADQIILGTYAKAILFHSFDNYAMPLGVITIPNVNVINKDVSIPGQTDISPLNIIPGVEDFTVSVTFTPYDNDANIRTLLGSTVGGLNINIQGGSRLLNSLVIQHMGGAVVHVSSLPYVRLATPQHIIYTRKSGIGYVYQNGAFVDSFPDTTDYSTALQYIGAETYLRYPVNSTIYNIFILNTGVTPLQAQSIWDNGGMLVNGLTGLKLFMAHPIYTDNAAAIVGGLMKGQKYQTSTGQIMAVY